MDEDFSPFVTPKDDIRPDKPRVDVGPNNPRPQFSTEEHQRRNIEFSRLEQSFWGKMHDDSKRHVEEVLKDFEVFPVKVETRRGDKLVIEIQQPTTRDPQADLEGFKKGDVTIGIPRAARAEAHLLFDSNIILIALNHYRMSSHSLTAVCANEADVLPKKDFATYFPENAEVHRKEYHKIEWEGNKTSMLIHSESMDERDYLTCLESYQPKRKKGER